MLYTILIIVKRFSLSYNIFFYTQLDFVFHIQGDFYIVQARIAAFFFLLQKDFVIFHEPFFVVFLCYLGNI